VAEQEFRLKKQHVGPAGADSPASAGAPGRQLGAGKVRPGGAGMPAKSLGLSPNKWAVVTARGGAGAPVKWADLGAGRQYTGDKAKKKRGGGMASRWSCIGGRRLGCERASLTCPLSLF
jgi:hypothetical protein